MLSNKWTFSLTSLVVMLALCFVASSAMAQFEIKLNVGDADVSFADGNQVVYGTGQDAATTINIMSTKVVNYHTTATAATAALTGDDQVVSGTALGADDFTVIAYNEFGGQVTGTDAPTLTFVTLPTDGTADGLHFMMTLTVVDAPDAETPNPAGDITRVLIYLPKEKVELADPRAELDAGERKAAGKSKEASIELHFVAATETDADGADGADGAPVGQPIVHAIARADGGLRPVTAATVDVLITLSEEPRKDGFKKDHIDAANATAGDPTLLDKMGATTDMPSSGRDGMLYRYLVTLTPKYENKNDIVVKVKSFYDQEKVMMKMYMPPAQGVGYIEGDDKLTVKVGKEVLKDKTAGKEYVIPKEIRIPNGGYLVLATSLADSGIVNSAEGNNNKDEPKASQRTPAQLLYNVITLGLPNLETFLANGGTIDLVAPNDLVISEIMWGSDASLDDNNKSQWIEIQNNSGASILTGDKTHKLMFYGPNETPPAKTAAVAATATAAAVPEALPAGVVDRVGTIDDKGGYWSLAGKGQSGRTGQGEANQPELTLLLFQHRRSSRCIVWWMRRTQRWTATRQLRGDAVDPTKCQL